MKIRDLSIPFIAFLLAAGLLADYVKRGEESIVVQAGDKAGVTIPAPVDHCPHAYKMADACKAMGY